MNDIVERFTIEGDTLYFGRSNERHGYNLGQLTDRSFNALDILNQHADEIERLTAVLEDYRKEVTRLGFENVKLREQLKAANAEVASLTVRLYKKKALKSDTLNDRGSNQYANPEVEFDLLDPTTHHLAYEENDDD